ncbi:MAG: Prolyl oligopeptidase family protein [Verrucomicrobia bacterium]|nr:Prolyl oligopeptidase family protein [Verrucomicrobiota bacterium]
MNERDTHPFDFPMRNISSFLFSVITLGAFSLAAIGAVPSGPSPQSLWDMKALSKAPATYPAEGISAKGVRAVFYEGPLYKGKPTRVFAYYGIPNVPAGQKVPAIVLVHGGGGTAFDGWVRLWNSRGYAAISMDLCGCVPVGKIPKWQRHEMGGPPGPGGFEQLDDAFADQWTGQAVSDVILAHSLLRSFPEVDASRIGITGISWGGYLTCIVAGLDQRFKFAVPVYGCGFLGDNSFWLDRFAKWGPVVSGRWLGQWDPSHYLTAAKLPMLWVTGTNDFAYPMDSLQKSYRRAPGPHTLTVTVRMPHGHPPGESPPEIQAFADSIFKGGARLAEITKQGSEAGAAWARYRSAVPVAKAELNYTTQGGKWQERRWETIPAALDAKRRRVTATPPAGTTVYYFNLTDERGRVVSTEHVEIIPKKNESS